MSQNKTVLLSFFVFLICITFSSHAQFYDQVYDPFADYSEFMESAEEEETINFFRNGRLLTVGLLGGYRGWTENLQNIYTGSPAFGLYLSYFFDLRFAIQFGILNSDHSILLRGNNFQTVTGTVSIVDLNASLKYYFNTQNVTRGLADLNPYIFIGASQVFRTSNVSSTASFGKDKAFGGNIGAGIEIPMMRNKMYFGLQGHYQLLTFPDANNMIYDRNDQPTGISPSGDSLMVLGILGINF